MNSFVALCFAISLSSSTLATPLSKSDASTSDTLPTVNSSALNGPFADTHHMGHGPVVVPSPDVDSAGSTPEDFPNVVDTHGDDSNHTYQPITPDQPSGNNTHHTHANKTVSHQVYQCDQRVHIQYLIDTVLLDRARDNPGCQLVVNSNNRTAHANSSTPTQNLSNPAYIGGGEAAAPPGFKPSTSLESSTFDNTTGGSTTGGSTDSSTSLESSPIVGNTTAANTTGRNPTMVDVRMEQRIKGTEITTTIRITEHLNPNTSPQFPDTPLPRYNGTSTPNTVPPVNDTPNPPNPNIDSVTPPPPAANPNGGTPFALPPGFTGP